MIMCYPSASSPPILPVPHQELEAKLSAKLQKGVAAAAGAAGKAGSSSGSSSGGLFNLTAIAHTILGNLQLRLSNIHIRCDGCGCVIACFSYCYLFGCLLFYHNTAVARRCGAA